MEEEAEDDWCKDRTSLIPIFMEKTSSPFSLFDNHKPPDMYHKALRARGKFGRSSNERRESVRRGRAVYF